MKSRNEIIKLFEDFKLSKYNLAQFCKRNNISQSSFRKKCKDIFEDQWDQVIEQKKPKQTQYQLGRSFEYRTRDLLLRAGYYVVRSAQSKGLVDLVALSKGRVLLVQCKRGGLLDKDEWDALFALGEKIGGIPVFTERSDGLNTNFWQIIGKKMPRRAMESLREFIL